MFRVSMRRFLRDRRGNVALIFALSLVPVIFLTGMALDFSSAMQKKTRLNAAADAGALAAVTPAMMIQSDAAAKTAAQNIFMAEASGMTGLTYNTPTVTVTDQGISRTVTVSYSAASTNAFPNVLGQTSWPISGSSQATSSTSPNIDFYLLLDNSPSMDLAATSDGITTMNNNTTSQGGCAFACHESNPSADNLGNPHGEDNYTLAANLGVVTRIENMAAATQALMSTASTTEAANNASYRAAIYTFNTGGTTKIQKLTSNLTKAGTAASGIDVLEVYQNNWLTSTNNNSDTDTDFDAAMSSIDGVMPNPGTGASTSTPQEVLFIVTDGVEDKVAATCTQTMTGTRCQQPFDTAWCTTEKNRGIRIAVLYTEYLPLPSSGLGSNSWYNSYVSPYQSTIGTNLQSCASPGLFFTVTTDGDITAAMQALFQQAVASARLTH